MVGQRRQRRPLHSIEFDLVRGTQQDRNHAVLARIAARDAAATVDMQDVNRLPPTSRFARISHLARTLSPDNPKLDPRLQDGSDKEEPRLRRRR
jgi:hypothetical protein